jgi:hypothetical protein
MSLVILGFLHALVCIFNGMHVLLTDVQSYDSTFFQLIVSLVSQFPGIMEPKSVTS